MRFEEKILPYKIQHKSDYGKCGMWGCVQEGTCTYNFSMTHII